MLLTVSIDVATTRCLLDPTIFISHIVLDFIIVNTMVAIRRASFKLRDSRLANCLYFADSLINIFVGGAPRFPGCVVIFEMVGDGVGSGTHIVVIEETFLEEGLIVRLVRVQVCGLLSVSIRLAVCL